jgi:hypothetical protein
MGFAQEDFAMADYGLFIGWGAPRPGKETAAGKLFEESVAYWNGLKASGEIEDFDLVVLNPHGGDLGGFALLQADPERLGRLRMSPEFQRRTMRAGVCLDSLGVVDAQVNGGAISSVQRWAEAVADLV